MDTSASVTSILSDDNASFYTSCSNPDVFDETISTSPKEAQSEAVTVRKCTNGQMKTDANDHDAIYLWKIQVDRELSKAESKFQALLQVHTAHIEKERWDAKLKLQRLERIHDMNQERFEAATKLIESQRKEINELREKIDELKVQGLQDIEKIQETLICDICLDFLHHPRVLQRCGHTFCESCIANWIKERRYIEICPTCRAYIIQKPTEAFFLKGLLGAIQGIAGRVGKSEERKERSEEAKKVIEDRYFSWPLIRSDPMPGLYSTSFTNVGLGLVLDRGSPTSNLVSDALNSGHAVARGPFTSLATVDGGSNFIRTMNILADLDADTQVGNELHD